MKKAMLVIALAVMSIGAVFAANRVASQPTQCAAKARTVASGDVVYWLDLFNSIGCEQTVVTNVGGGNYFLQPVHHD